MVSSNYENKHIDVISYICLYASSQIRTGDGMSKVIQTLTAIAGNKSGSPLLDAFERENLVYYPIDATIEPEIKMLWSTRIKTTKNQLKKIFNSYSNVTTHDKTQDHFIYIPHTIEENNYDLTSFAVDTFKRDPKTGGPIPTMQLTNEGYQARLRMAISLASREEQLLEQIKNYNSPDQLSKNSAPLHVSARLNLVSKPYGLMTILYLETNMKLKLAMRQMSSAFT